MFWKMAPVQGPQHILFRGGEESWNKGVKVVNLDTEKVMKEPAHRNEEDLYLSVKLAKKLKNCELLEQ